jgi:hypothetical protein
LLDQKKVFLHIFTVFIEAIQNANIRFSNSNQN